LNHALDRSARGFEWVVSGLAKLDFLTTLLWLKWLSYTCGSLGLHLGQELLLNYRFFLYAVNFRLSHLFLLFLAFLFGSSCAQIALIENGAVVTLGHGIVRVLKSSIDSNRGVDVVLCRCYRHRCGALFRDRKRWDGWLTDARLRAQLWRTNFIFGSFLRLRGSLRNLIQMRLPGCRALLWLHVEWDLLCRLYLLLR